MPDISGLKPLPEPFVLPPLVRLAMSGVWYFKDGVMRLVENPLAEDRSGEDLAPQRPRQKILVHCASNERITSFDQLDDKLTDLGWRRYFSNNLQSSARQYHRGSHSSDLITLPVLFTSLRSPQMYDIVLKTRSAFQVRDA